MRPRHATGVLSSNPTLVGAVTVLVTIVAVFLAYNANSGLPFVPTYDLNVLVPQANSLVRGNEVRIGGARVGIVRAVTPERLPDGRVVAKAELALDEAVRPLPVDSKLMIRPRSTLALKYLEVRPGDSEEGFETGATVPLAAASPEPVELDQFFNTFDERTRRGSQGNFEGFGNALAGRGIAINEALGEAPGVLEKGERVGRNVNAPGTRFGRFWRELASLAAEVAPVAENQAGMFRGLDSTFAAFASVAYPYIQRTIEESPATLDEGTRSLPVMRPFLRHSREFFNALAPGAASLVETSPAIAAALQAGGPVLARTPRLNRQLPPTADALLDFAQDPAVDNGLRQLIDTNRILDPTMRFLAPAQTTCNYLALLFRNVADLTALGDDAQSPSGHWVRFFAFSAPLGPNNEGVPASAPAEGGGEEGNYLHSNPYPNTAAPGQTFECEAGRERYLRNRVVIGNAPGNQGIRTEEQTPEQRGEGKR